MHEIAKHEFLSWVETLDTEKLTEYEITVLSIFIDNFEEIASVGTVAGQRAKLLGKKISELKNKVIKTLPHYKNLELAESVVERIESLDVEKFRGFSTEQNFNFEKQYTFFHGPNGSGKTSFCEALEYCMLGTIEEATARNIALDKYIVHVGEKKAKKPVLKCKYSSGEVKECQPNYTNYRFGFIEKNRIDGFSHISATTAKTQTERMAALFGLSEFQEYVKGFTSAEGLGNDKYVKVSMNAQGEYEKANEKIAGLKKQVNESGEALKAEKESLEALIKALKNDEIKTKDDIDAYFTDAKEGLITKYTLEAEENKWVVLEKDELEKLKSDIGELVGYYDEIQKSNSEILSDVGAVNLVELFNAVSKMDSSEYTQCPVCLTPLDRATVNPFEHAKNELERLDKIELAKKAVRENAKKIIENYERIFKAIIKIKPANVLGDVKYDLIENRSLQSTDVEALSGDIIVLFTELKRISDFLDNADTKEITFVYNTKAAEHNKKYDEKLDKVQKDYKAIVEKGASVDAKQKSHDELVKNANEEEEKIKDLKKKAEEEKVEVEFNKKIVEAYGNIVDRLSTYVSGLPATLAQNLSEKVMEYYNCINEDDADFELLTKLSLPIAANEKIVIELEDGVKQDALQILSEGHVKILGLSILLAKAVYENSPFLIFDDIVNSVDDDHRDGVARLLITHSDFANMQMILTCHGELFVSKLESYVVDKGTMMRYMFLPADSLEERGVFIKYQDASIPLMTAREKFNDNQLKDCAAKCRQAVECIAGKLWRIVSKYSAGGISVTLRSLEGTPDLKNVTTALYGATKPSKLLGAEELNDNLKILIADQMWVLLNKGTHVDGTIPEFERGEVKKLLELVEKISTEVDELKIKPVNLAASE